MLKKVNGNWDIINKNGHSTFNTGKPGNFRRHFKRRKFVMTLLP